MNIVGPIKEEEIRLSLHSIWMEALKPEITMIY